MAKEDGTATFKVNITGETTDEQWVGEFQVKRALSYREQLERDRHRRELVGQEVGNPDARALSIALIFAELWPRIVQAPSWWTEKGNGLDLLDSNVAPAVYDKAMEHDLNEIKAKAKRVEEAKKILEAEAAKQKAEQGPAAPETLPAE